VICLVRTATCLLGCSTSVSVRAQVSHLPRTAAPSCSTWALAGVKTFSSARTVLARIIHRTARNRPRPPNTWARDFIAKNFIKQPIRIVVNDINGLALIAHFS